MSIAEAEPVPGCRYVEEPLLSTDRLLGNRKSSISLPLLFVLSQPQLVLRALKSSRSNTGGVAD